MSELQDRKTCLHAASRSQNHVHTLSETCMIKACSTSLLYTSRSTEYNGSACWITFHGFQIVYPCHLTQNQSKMFTPRSNDQCQLVIMQCTLPSNFQIRRDVICDRLRISDELPLNVRVVYGIAAKHTYCADTRLSEIRNLPCVRSRLISKLDREYI